MLDLHGGASPLRRPRPDHRRRDGGADDPRGPRRGGRARRSGSTSSTSPPRPGADRGAALRRLAAGLAAPAARRARRGRARGPRPRAARRRPAVSSSPCSPTGCCSPARRSWPGARPRTCCARSGPARAGVGPLSRPVAGVATGAGRVRRRPDKTRGQAFVAAGVTLALCGLGLGFVDITRVGVLLPRAPAGRRVPGPPPARCAARRAATWMPPRVGVDEPATVTVSIEERRRGRRSPLLLVEERLELRPRRPAALPARGDVGPGRGGRQVDYAIRSHLRGRHRLGPLAVQGCATPSGSPPASRRSGGTTRSSSSPASSRSRGAGSAGQGLRPGGRDPAHGGAARRGRPVDPRVPRRRRPAPHPLAGHGPDRRPHGPPGGPPGAATGGAAARPARRRPPRLGRRVGVVRVGGDGDRVGAASGTSPTPVSPSTSSPARAPATAPSPRCRGTPTPPSTCSPRLGTGSDDGGARPARPRRPRGPRVAGRARGRRSSPTATRRPVRQVASLRQPGSTGLAVVLDTASFGDQEGARPVRRAPLARRRGGGGPGPRPVTTRRRTPTCSASPAGTP